MSPLEDPDYQQSEPRVPSEISSGIIISSDTYRDQRIPPGQSRTRKWPVLHYGYVPQVPLDKWRLKIFGLVNQELTLSWEEFQQLPRVQVYADFHCVTRWSRLDNIWEGVSIAELLTRSGVKPEARYAVAHGYDSGWTTNLPLADLQGEDCLVADLHDGKPLTEEHGGPARLIVPRLYAWKSAKWLRGLELTAEDHPGYWEQAGYHNQGDSWKEERFQDGF